jgi:hypothetical protein
MLIHLKTGKELHKYKQDEQTAHHLKQLNTTSTNTHTDENPGLDLGQVQQCGGVKLVNEIPNPLILDNWISNSNTYTNIF